MRATRNVAAAYSAGSDIMPASPLSLVDRGDGGGGGGGGCYGDERGPKTIRFHSTVIGSRSRSPGVRGSALLKAERVLCNELPPTTASHHGFPPFSRPRPRPLFPPALFVPAERFETATTPPSSLLSRSTHEYLEKESRRRSSISK